MFSCGSDYFTIRGFHSSTGDFSRDALCPTHGNSWSRPTRDKLCLDSRKFQIACTANDPREAPDGQFLRLAYFDAISALDTVREFPILCNIEPERACFAYFAPA